MQPNEIIRQYLLNELAEEENQREINRKLADEAVEREKENILAIIDKDSRIEEYRKRALREFWQTTYEIYGEDVLTTQRPPNIAQAIQELEEQLSEQSTKIIYEIVNNELEMTGQLQDMQEQEEEEEHIQNTDNQEDEYEHNEEHNEGEEDEYEKLTFQEKINIFNKDFSKKSEQTEEKAKRPAKSKDSSSSEQHEEVEHHEQEPYKRHSELVGSERESVEYYKTSEQNEHEEHEGEEGEEIHEHRERNEESEEAEPSSKRENRPSELQIHPGSTERAVQSAHLLGSSNSPTRTGPFYPKYITKREKMEALMRNPMYVQTHKELSSPVSEKRAIEYRTQRQSHRKVKTEVDPFTVEPAANIPEERGIRVTDEQPFVEDFDMEDMPRKLKVSMQQSMHTGYGNTMDIDEVDYPEAWTRKSKSRMESPSKVSTKKGFPLESLIDEKSFIKKNIDNYQPFEPEDPNVFAKNAFADVFVSKGGENDAVLDRLKSRYEAAYRDNFLIDRAETRYIESTKQKRVNLPETEFLSEGKFGESKLLSTLKSPVNAKDLKKLDNEIASQSFQDYKAANTPKKYSPSKNDRGREEEDVYYRASRARSRGKSMEKEKKNIPLFDQFEREIFEIASNNTRSFNNLGGREGAAASQKSVFIHKSKPKYQNIGEVEDFILELYRSISTNNGAVPPKYQHKLQEILKRKPAYNKYFELRKSAFPQDKEAEEEQSENGGDKSSEINLLKDAFAFVSNEVNSKAIDALKPNPDNKLRNKLWQCVMALQANFDGSIDLVNQHLVTKYDRITKYTSQPGKVMLNLRALGQRIKKEQVKRTLYDDFQNFFSEIEDELVKTKLEDNNEILLLRYIYMIKRFIEVLDKEGRLNMINNTEHKIVTNTKMNQKLLENYDRRRADMGARRVTSPGPGQDEYGIDFNKWEENLQKIERENKMLIKFGEEKKRKEQKAEKLEEAKLAKEAEAKAYQENIEESNKERAIKEELRKNAIAEKSKWINERIQTQKETKAVNKEVQKKIQDEEIKRTITTIQHRNQEKQRAKEEIKSRQKERLQKLEEDKKLKIVEKNKSEKTEKEELAWKKAQDLFDKQRRLLAEREKLSQELKVTGK